MSVPASVPVSVLVLVLVPMPGKCPAAQRCWGRSLRAGVPAPLQLCALLEGGHQRLGQLSGWVGSLQTTGDTPQLLQDPPGTPLLPGAIPRELSMLGQQEEEEEEEVEKGPVPMGRCVLLGDPVCAHQHPGGIQPLPRERGSCRQGMATCAMHTPTAPLPERARLRPR